MIDLVNRYKGIVFYNPAECRCIMDMRTVELIKKDLAILDIFKKIISVVPNTKDTAGPKYYIGLRSDIILDDVTKKIIKEWLDGIGN